MTTVSEPTTTAITINGVQTTLSMDHPNLLAALRHEAGVTSPKDGCSPSGQCGCCTVLLDGKAMISCSTYGRRRWRFENYDASSATDRSKNSILTKLSSVREKTRATWRSCFGHRGVIKCGSYCSWIPVGV